MPKQPINYQNNVIYKFVCNDLEITDIYLGHTSNFIKRKGQHKDHAVNETKKSGSKFYQTIKNNGGWENWTMLQVEEYPCNNKREAEVRERYWIEQLKSTLNSNIPTRTFQEYYETNKEIICEKVRKYQQQNKEKVAEKDKQKYEGNKEQILARQKEYYEANKEQIAEKGKQYREINKEQIAERRKQYREANKEQIAKRKKQYYETNKEQILAKQKQYQSTENGCC